MIWVIFNILCSVAMISVFRLLKTWQLPTFQVVVINYGVCVLLGATLSDEIPFFKNTPPLQLVLLTVILGIQFISVFVLIGITTQEHGMTVAAMVSKLALVIPVGMAFYLYREEVSISKISGILLALLALFLMSMNREKKANSLATAEKKRGRWFLLPVTFLGAGMVDTMINYTQNHLKGEVGFDYLSQMIFGSACLVGFMIGLIHPDVTRKSYSWKVWVAGILLGVPNYFSLVSILKALATEGMEATVVWPLAHIGVVTASATVGMIFWGEKKGWLQWSALMIAITSILILTLG